jgi:hypothetical protein
MMNLCLTCSVFVDMMVCCYCHGEMKQRNTSGSYPREVLSLAVVATFDSVALCESDPLTSVA